MPKHKLSTSDTKTTLTNHSQYKTARKPSSFRSKTDKKKKKKHQLTGTARNDKLQNAPAQKKKNHSKTNNNPNGSTSCGRDSQRDRSSHPHLRARRDHYDDDDDDDDDSDTKASGLDRCGGSNVDNPTVEQMIRPLLTCVVLAVPGTTHHPPPSSDLHP